MRMTDGISFSLSSSCLSNKGLIEGAGLRQEETAGQAELERRMRGTKRRSPDGVPHVESVQRLRPVGAPSRQADEGWQPIRDVDELVAGGSRLLQQRAGDESYAADPSFPQRPLPPSQRPVAPTVQRLTAVICPTSRRGDLKSVNCEAAQV